MPRLSYAEAEWLAEFQEGIDAQAARADNIVEKAQRLRMHEPNQAYREIERLAERLVSKSAGPLSKDAAVAKVLKTAEGKALYDSYTSATERLMLAGELIEQDRAGRQAREWELERLVGRVVKSAGLGEPLATALQRELSDPAVAVAVGAAPLAPVEKGAAAWDEIERRAERLVQKSAGPLSREQAVDQVLQANPELYTAYVREQAAEPVEKADDAWMYDDDEDVEYVELQKADDDDLYLEVF